MEAVVADEEIPEKSQTEEIEEDKINDGAAKNKELDVGAPRTMVVDSEAEAVVVDLQATTEQKEVEVEKEEVVTRELGNDAPKVIVDEATVCELSAKSHQDSKDVADSSVDNEIQMPETPSAASVLEDIVLKEDDPTKQQTEIIQEDNIINTSVDKSEKVERAVLGTTVGDAGAEVVVLDTNAVTEQKEEDVEKKEVFGGESEIAAPDITVEPTKGEAADGNDLSMSPNFCT